MKIPNLENKDHPSVHSVYCVVHGAPCYVPFLDTQFRFLGEISEFDAARVKNDIYLRTVRNEYSSKNQRRILTAAGSVRRDDPKHVQW